MSDDLADMHTQALAAHAAIDHWFDAADARQVAEARRAAAVIEASGNVLALNKTVLALLAPVRAYNFRLRMKAHEELDSLVQSSIAQAELSLAEADGAAVVRH